MFITDLKWLAIVSLAGAVSGCGLISSDITNFDLTLPDKDFAIDSASWMVDGTLVQSYLATSCASTPTVCNSAAMQACAKDCTGLCDSTSHTCDLSLAVGLYQMIDLVSEKPELKQINDQPVIKVVIDHVTYAVTANTLDIPTPPMTIYVAPTSVMDPKDPSAKAIGTIAAVPAMTTTVSPQEMVYTATGKADLVAIMSTFKTPFNLIVGATLTLKAGDPVPAGKLEAIVHIEAHAGI